MAVTINDATRIIDLTVGQAEDLFRSWVRNEVASVKASEAAESASNRRHVYGLKGLAKLLGCSVTRACQINTSGDIDPARVKYGNIMIFDADLVLELLRHREEAKQEARSRGRLYKK